jgi:hypothetical protein
MTAYTRSARDRGRQDWWLIGVGSAGAVLGILMTLLLPRLLPGSIDMAVAATAMNADRWDAGIALMKSGSPSGWNALMESNNLVRDNADVLSICIDAAAKVKKSQSCTIVVSAPATQTHQ